jgi:hypothetical protein
MGKIWTVISMDEATQHTNKHVMWAGFDPVDAIATFEKNHKSEQIVALMSGEVYVDRVQHIGGILMKGEGSVRSVDPFEFPD